MIGIIRLLCDSMQVHKTIREDSLSTEPGLRSTSTLHFLPPFPSCACISLITFSVWCSFEAHIYSTWFTSRLYPALVTIHYSTGILKLAVLVPTLEYNVSTLEYNTKARGWVSGESSDDIGTDTTEDLIELFSKLTPGSLEENANVKLDVCTLLLRICKQILLAGRIQLSGHLHKI